MRDELIFEIAGSAGVVYEVRVLRAEGRLNLSCSCDAGRNGMACKHRIALLSGDAAAVISNNAAAASSIVTWLPDTPLAQAIAALADAEATAEVAKRAVTKAKKSLGRVMAGADH